MGNSPAPNRLFRRNRVPQGIGTASVSVFTTQASPDADLRVLMSPLSTFKNCGISSKRNSLIIFPTRVTRDHCSAAQTAPLASASVRMDRNRSSCRAASIQLVPADKNRPFLNPV